MTKCGSEVGCPVEESPEVAVPIRHAVAVFWRVYAELACQPDGLCRSNLVAGSDDNRSPVDLAAGLGGDI